MSHVLRWVLVVLLVAHGLIHLLGAAKGFGWAAVSQLKEPIGPGGGALWLLAAMLLLASAALLAAGASTWWWAVVALGAVVSQIAIVTSWSDAKYGTVVNLILLLAAAYGFAALGPTSFHAQFRDLAAEAVADVRPKPGPLVSEEDLAELPEPLAAYVRRSGALGKPRVTSFSAQFHGRIRSGPDQAWMPFTGRQVNTYGPRPRRVFLMDATRSGLPVTVLHSFKDGTATMRVKALSLFSVVDASGAEMNRGETVTVFNDLVVLAPAAIVDAPVRWTAVDAQHVRGVFTDGDQTVSAELTFNAEHDLVDFTSDDRSRASTDGKSFDPLRWSTPLSGHRDLDGRRIMTTGEGRWHAPLPEGLFTYLEFHIDDIAYNLDDVDGAHVSSSPAPAGVSR